MIRYIVLKPFFIYSNFLFDTKDFIFSKQCEPMLIEAINQMKEMQSNYSSENHDEDDIDIKLFKHDDFILQHFDIINLTNTVSKEITLYQPEDKNFNVIIDIYNLSNKFNTILYSSLSNCLKDLVNEASIDKIYRVINFISEIIKAKSFKKASFIEICLNDLLNLIYQPKNRNNSNLFMKVTEILLELKSKLPNRATQLIGFLFLFKKRDYDFAALKLIPLFDTNQLQNVHEQITAKFETEMKNSKEFTKEALDIMKYYPQVKRLNPDLFYDHLIYYLDKYSKSKNINDPCLSLLKILLDILAPVKEKSTSLSIIIKKSKTAIPQYLIDKSPQFWTIYNKYHPLIMKKIRKDTYILKYFRFLLNYPEILSFKIRSSYFKKYMKSKISDQKFQ